MEQSSTIPSFDVVGSSGRILTTPESRESASGSSLEHKLSASLPLPSSVHVDRSSAHNDFMQAVRRPTSSQFAEQIRQLEIEGHKLRTATVSALSQGSGVISSSGLTSSEVKQVTSPLNSSLASLVDISAEQKTIADLRIQLDNQRRETERLQSHLLGDSSSTTGHSFSNGPFSFTSTPMKAAFSTVPSSEFSSHMSARRGFESAPPSHMERALKESQEQVVELRKKLQDATENAEQQKRQFRAHNEELKTKLHETIVNRDTVLELRQKEATSQERLIHKLQESLIKLQEQCRAQEQSLSELSKAAESSSQFSQASELAVSQLRAVLASREHARGRPFLEGDPAASSHSTAALTLSLEKCLQEADQEVDSARKRALQLEREVEEMRTRCHDKEQALLKDQQERVNGVTSDLEKRLEEANERAANARKQSAVLQEQLHVLEEQQKQQGRMKNETIGELEAKLKQVKQDYADDYARWQQRRQALETSLDDVQRELAKAKAERTEATRGQASADTKAEDLQALVSRLEADLETERDRVRAQREREEELRLKVLSLEGQMSHKDQEQERLQRMLEVVKQEASLQMHNRVASTEKQERDRYVDQINTLTSQLSCSNEKKTQLSVDNERLRMETESLRQQMAHLRADYQAAHSQTSSARAEKDQLFKQAEEERGECERLRQECERYRRGLEEKAEEVATLRSAVERATLQLEEKEKVLSTVKQQSSSISQLMEVNTRASDNMREERERLAQQVESKTAAVEELRAAYEATSKKLKMREKRVRDLEDERVKLVEEVGEKGQEARLAQQEKEEVFSELKEARLEVARVTSGRDQLRKDLTRLKASHAKELDKLHKRLREAEREYKLTHKALRTKDSVDQKAVKVADQIQKEITAKRSEVDNLRSKARRLEERMETLAKEKLMVERDKDSLKASLARSLLHTTKLTEELEASQAFNSRLTRRNKELEDALEKEALKAASTNTQLEQYDQEVATLKLRHQLDLKEATQLNKKGLKSSKVAWVPVKDNKAGGAKEVQSNSKEEKEACEQPNRNNSSRASKSDKGNLRKVPSPLLQHDSYTEAGKELKSLLSEMRQLIHGQREINQKSRRDSPLTSARLSSPLKSKTPRRRSSSSGEGRSHHEASSLSTSFPPDLTGLSAPSGSRSSPPSPRRAASSVWPGDDDPSYYQSRGSHSDITDFASTVSSPFLENEGAMPGVPDTTELCRRLEEKIANLTRMGSNLQHENQEMAQLITAQGQKLDKVRKNERHMTDGRR